MLPMPGILIALVVFSILGGVISLAVPLILMAMALRRRRAALTAMLAAVPNGEGQGGMPQPNLPPGWPPHAVLPPVSPPPNGGNIHMPGGPALIDGQVFVPGVTPRWRR